MTQPTTQSTDITASSPVNPAQGTWPLFIRKFIVDFVETAIGAVLALSIAIPTSIATLQQMVAVVGIALVGALVSAFRREAPDFIQWLKDKLGTS